MNKLRLGFIGLGHMGKPMAINLLRAGYPLVVHNRSQGKVQELVSLGAQAAKTPQEVAAQSRCGLYQLARYARCVGCRLGQDGIREGAHPGLIYVDHSTIKPSASREIYDALRQVGVSALDAPVSGGDIGAQQGTLAIMVGGDAEALEQVRPILEVVGKTITHVGGPGSGQVAKAANQIMVAAQMVAMGELLILRKRPVPIHAKW